MKTYPKVGVWIFFLFYVHACAAAKPECAQDTRSNAKKLLTLHKGKDTPMTIDRRIKQLPSVKSISGKRSYKVFEVWGRIGKERYRMRFIYAVLPKYANLGGSNCGLMGQEILTF